MAKKILVCDDTRPVLDMIHTWLHDEGLYTVTRGDNLKRAQDQYAIGKFDLVISDDLDGGGVAWLWQLHKEGQLVLSTTAIYQTPDLPSLPKPLNKEEFLANARELLEQTNSA